MSAEPCLICSIHPDLYCSSCKKAYCGTCWKYKPTCHNAPYIPINGWSWSEQLKPGFELNV